ncbi:uncharacterized protein LOC132314971 [Cornus florida]|uniref:uncharacterized protein LOC132314971 n=1 Tax=Cornus florida TaxID=4283 RepID=UPI00289A8391|nr:uncharacterized protein LOC132314971 [Cornus florida]
MTSIPQYYSDYIFPSELCEFPIPTAGGANVGAAIWSEESLVPFIQNGALDHMVPPESDIMSSMPLISLPERFGVSDMAVPTLPEFSRGSFDIVGSRSFEGTYQSDLCEFGEECNGTVYSKSSDNYWGIQGKPTPAIEEPTVQIGRYSVEERKDRILKYLKKRNRRNFNKRIKYACRKTLADKRVRIRGRFARNNGLAEEAGTTKKNTNPHVEREFYNDIQIKHDGEDWFQEAIASLIY